MSRANILIVMVLGVIFVQCSPPFEEVSWESRKVTEDPGVMDFNGKPRQLSDEPYRLDKDDVIRVTVDEFPEFSMRAKIEYDGKVEVPLVERRVDLIDLTSSEAADRYYDKIKDMVKIRPKINVTVLAAP